MILPESRYSVSSYKPHRPRKFRFFIILIGFCILTAIVIVLLNTEILTSRSVASVDFTESVFQSWDTGDYKRVIEICEEQLTKNPLDAIALSFGGFAHFYVGVDQYTLEEQLLYIDKAVMYLRKALIGADDNLQRRVQYVLGKSYYHKGKFYADLSIQNMEESIREGFIQEDSYQYLGLAYTEIGAYNMAIDSFVEANKRQSSGILYLTIAQSYYKMGDTENAERYLRFCIQEGAEPSVTEKSLFLLGKIYLELEEFQSAEKAYRQILDINARSADAHYHLGEVFEATGDSIKARAEWRKTLDIDPSHYGAKLKLY